MTGLQILILLALSIVPAVLLLYYFLKQDTADKEPQKLIWKVFRYGMLIVFFAAIIEIFIESFFVDFVGGNQTLYIILFAALMPGIVEESLKFWVVKDKVYDNKHFSEPMDGIMYAVVASLGFAALENVFYIFGEETFEFGLLLGGFRAALSVPGHALFSGVMGYYIGQAKYAGDKIKEKKLLRKGLLLAICFHAGFNFIVSFDPFVGIPTAFVLVISMFFFLRKKIKKLQMEAKELGAKHS